MKPQVEREPPSSSKKRVTTTVKLGEWRYPVLLYLGDVYGLECLEAGGGGKGVARGLPRTSREPLKI